MSSWSVGTCHPSKRTLKAKCSPILTLKRSSSSSSIRSAVHCDDHMVTVMMCARLQLLELMRRPGKCRNLSRPRRLQHVPHDGSQCTGASSIGAGWPHDSPLQPTLTAFGRDEGNAAICQPPSCGHHLELRMRHAHKRRLQGIKRRTFPNTCITP